MANNNDNQKWYDSLPKKMKKLLDLWEENELHWIGPAWEENPQSVELNCSTGAGEDMSINLEKISVDALEDYVNGFDINYEVSLWWPDGKPGRGVPFDNQAEQIEDYEDYLAWLRDIIDASRNTKRKISNQQQVVVEKLEAVAKDLELLGLTFTYTPKRGFRYHKV